MLFCKDPNGTGIDETTPIVRLIYWASIKPNSLFHSFNIDHGKMVELEFFLSIGHICS